MSSRYDKSDASAMGCALALLMFVGLWLWPAQPLAVIAVVIGLGIILPVANAILTTREERKEQEEAERRREEQMARIEAARLAAEQQLKDQMARQEAARLAVEQQRKDQMARLEAARLAAERQRKDQMARLEAERLAAEQQRKDQMARLEAERLAQERKREEEAARLREELALTRLYTWNQQFDGKPWASRVSLDIPSDLLSRTTFRFDEHVSPQARKLVRQREAETRTTRARTEMETLESILAHRVDQVGWKILIDNSHTTVHSGHAVPQPEAFKRFEPAELAELTPHALSEYTRLLAIRETEYIQGLDAWKEEHEARKAALQELQNQYSSGEASAIEEYSTMILATSGYPSCFPHTYSVALNLQSRLLLVDYQLPAMTELPTLQEVRYVVSRDQFVEKHVTQSQLRQFYDGVLYQIALRVIYELFSADEGNYLAVIVFNGYVQSTDLATGHQINPCIISVQADKTEFMGIDLSNVDPKACFRKLKGVSSANLHSLTPIPPILTFNRDDLRFVTPRAVVDTLGEGDNLAAMDWEDFEHLVRELFGEEFARPGGEVKVTRASRDGGIDAVAFDPDPIHGGKIVIQAKRYTNTVGVSAVRDLYGTVLNEGANKGILVTTSNYGPDAYDFARGKPLTLLNGSNLLHLLEKHGHKAHIDLSAARHVISQDRNSDHQ